jgi:hypothetical protein
MNVQRTKNETCGFQMAIQKPDCFVWFSNGYSKMAARNSLSFGWTVSAETPDMSSFKMLTVNNFLRKNIGID